MSKASSSIVEQVEWYEIVEVREGVGEEVIISRHIISEAIFGIV